MMNRRQKLVQQQFLNSEEKVIKRLDSVYAQSLKDIKGKIQNLSFTIGKLQQEYDWMDDLDPEKARIKSMIQSKIYQKQYQEQLQKQVEGILKKMQTSQFVTVSDYLDECYSDGFIGTIFDAHGQGVPFTAPINQEAMVRAVQLDSKISKGLYTRLGEDVDLLKKKIIAQVSRSIATGMTYAQTAKALENYSRIGYNNAIRIARTEGHRIQTTATMDAMKAAKDRGADVVKQWDSTLDGRTRDSHAQVDGEIRELNKPFSNGLDYPGDPDGKAAEVINCRCALLQRARWALDDGFTKFNNFTKQIETFDSPDDYDKFKKAFFSKENKAYMNYVEQMQDKYGTRNFPKVLELMTGREYSLYSRLLANNPIYNKNAPAPAGKYAADYNTELAQKFGNAHYDAIHQMAVDCTDQDAMDVWKQYESQIKVADAHYNGWQHASGDSIFVDIDALAKGNNYEKPYQVIFHECGHAIDSLARSKISGGHWFARHYSSAYKDGLFPNTIRDEVNAMVKAKDIELKALWKQHAGDADWFRSQGYMSMWSSSIPKYKKAYAYTAVEKEIRAIGSKYAYGDLSDIMEGATRGKIKCGIGHGASYWNDRTYDGVHDGLATEAFAEMMDSTFASPESLETIKKYLPKSYTVFQEMLKEILK